jgi:hypothetical protein
MLFVLITSLFSDNKSQYLFLVSELFVFTKGHLNSVIVLCIPLETYTFRGLGFQIFINSLRETGDDVKLVVHIWSLLK